MITTPKRVGRLTASLIGAVGVILWATETMLVTLTTSIPPLQTVALAFMFSAAMSPAVWLLTGSHPLEAFRQPIRVWVFTVVSLVGYHSCIYYATQQAPPAAAALLQSTTPLMIVLGSAFLPGERLRWWHVVGALLGFVGVTMLVETGGEGASTGSSFFYLALIGVAAGLWGLYSVIARTLPDVPSSTLGVFYAASAVITFAAHFLLETWVPPQPIEWFAVAALGIFPMGLAIYFWDFGLKRGDIQALGAFSYVEPFIGAVLVAVFTGAALSLSLFWSGLLVVTGAVIASAGLWKKSQTTFPAIASSALPETWLTSVSTIASRTDLLDVTNRVVTRLVLIGRDYDNPRSHDREMKELLFALGCLVQIWDELESEHDDNAQPSPSCTLVA
ncbi:drug/metabolite transporter (DMT)-like permease [Rhizobium skierniewicense]|uniref:Drug/metabolite transporter (DMT)-like permease n=1 Tax=Rhizobium skierniewicense TaxID=984260 RepID=A0A7W6C5X4_9HYPH|nr:DMT family transporter [Rhizobium skierniewicense]MBB3944518.1 drug/metabolite transporter (DMT)-like permease [Rhizobium skierniewicense]